MQITPRVLKGFRDFLPADEARRAGFVRILEDTFRSFGFVPIDTPVLEYADVLLGKGGGETDKQVYRFQDHGGRDVALRFDLTVPFARYMAQHHPDLPIPFKRYHIDKVFRGENTQRGRYREFTQCDFDIVGTTSPSADLEIITVIAAAFRAIGVDGIRIHVSHRGLLNRYLEKFGIERNADSVLRAIDKIRKVGRDATLDTLRSEIGAEAAEGILAFIALDGDFREILARAAEILGDDTPELSALRRIGTAIEELDLSSIVRLDPSITRGLDYYTGIVYETFLVGAEAIGSVCSGGRYDDLVALYSKTSMPGVGASIGLDRLLAALEELDLVSADGGGADVMIAMQDEELLGHYHRVATVIRGAGFRCDVFPDRKKLGQQFAFAEKKSIPIVLICGREEYASQTVNIRKIGDRTQYDGLSLDGALERIGAIVRDA
jgi:histidyl-tRNA synthetase